jgi:hypothetical protein
MNADGTQATSYIIHSHGSQCDEEESSGLYVHRVYPLIYMPDQLCVLAHVSVRITGGLFTFH